MERMLSTSLFAPGPKIATLNANDEGLGGVKRNAEDAVAFSHLLQVHDGCLSSLDLHIMASNRGGAIA